MSGGVDVDRERMINAMIESLHDPAVTGDINVSWRSFVVNTFRIVDRRTKVTSDRVYGIMNQPDAGALDDLRHRLLFHWIETLEQAKNTNNGLDFIRRISTDRLMPSAATTEGCSIS